MRGCAHTTWARNLLNGASNSNPEDYASKVGVSHVTSQWSSSEWAIAPLEIEQHRLGARFVFCDYDRVAGPALRSLRRAALTVPGDVAVVGYDDEESAKPRDPPLTTIRQPYEEPGVLAVSLAIQAQSRPLTTERRTIIPTLRKRHSA